MDKISHINPGDVLSAKSLLNPLVMTANRVNNMTGNVKHTSEGIHIPYPKGRYGSLANQGDFYQVSATCPADEYYPIGSVVRVVRADRPDDNTDLYEGWLAYVVGISDVGIGSDAYKMGHLGYAIVTEDIGSDANPNATPADQSDRIGAIAIKGQVPVLVRQPADLQDYEPEAGTRYAVVDIDSAVAGTPDYPYIYGKNRRGCVASFRVLYEDQTNVDGAPLEDLHWALVDVDMGRELEGETVSIKSTYTESITEGQPAQITDEYDGCLEVTRPTESSLSPAQVVFPIGVVGTASASPYGFARCGSAPIWVSYTGAAPSVGDEIGTVANSFEFSTGNTGFICVGVDTTNSKALIRPNSVGGTSNIKLIEATSVASGTLTGYDIAFNGAFDGKNWERLDTSATYAYIRLG